MKLDGSYTFDAPRDLVWELLREPRIIQQALPECDHFHQRGDGTYHVILRQNTGPFRGRYDGVITLVDGEPHETFTLSMTGSGGENAVAGMGTLTLEENRGQTVLFYEGDVEATGQIPTTSPRLVRTTANYLIRNFLENIDQQTRYMAGSAGDNGLPPVEETFVERKTATISMQDFLAEIKRDRWVAVTVLVLLLIATFSLLGMVFVGLLLTRWATRALSERGARPPDGQLDDALS